MMAPCSVKAWGACGGELFGRQLKEKIGRESLAVAAYLLVEAGCARVFRHWVILVTLLATVKRQHSFLCNHRRNAKGTTSRRQRRRQGSRYFSIV
jgi:hypothetical protein